MEKQEVKYQKNYEDTIGERLVIRYEKKDSLQITINDGDVVAELDYNDLDWIIDVLYEVRQIHKENIKGK
jgi:hypothetical protein